MIGVINNPAVLTKFRSLVHEDFDQVSLIVSATWTDFGVSMIRDRYILSSCRFNLSLIVLFFIQLKMTQ